jgi:hypothetical protein
VAFYRYAYKFKIGRPIFKNGNATKTSATFHFTDSGQNTRHCFIMA